MTYTKKPSMFPKGSNTFFTSKEWREAERQALARDNRRCRRCGLFCGHNGYRVAHRLSPIDYPDQATDVGNLVTLCLGCHGYMNDIGAISAVFVDKPAQKSAETPNFCPVGGG